MCGVGFEDQEDVDGWRRDRRDEGIVDGCVVLDSKIRKMLMDGEETAAMKAPES